MTLEEIFTDKPELLNEPDVKRLIAYVQEQHKITVGIYNQYQEAYSKVIDRCMHSERVVIAGTPCSSVVRHILNDYETNDLF